MGVVCGSDNIQWLWVGRVHIRVLLVDCNAYFCSVLLAVVHIFGCIWCIVACS